GARKHIGIITLEPGRNINQKCKAHGMTFRKSITPKSFQLPEYPFRIVATVPVSCHSLDQLIPEVRYLSIYLKGCHAPSQLVRFSRRKTSGNDGSLHGLLLEQRYPQGATKNILKFFGGILHGLLTVTSTQVWVHHIALDGSRSDDRHLDHQIVKGLRFQPGQHRHLRPAFDLKHPDSIRPAYHFIHCRVILRDIRQSKLEAVMLPCE